MVVSGLRALTVGGEHCRIDVQLSGKIMQNGNGYGIACRQTETRMAHQGNVTCEAKSVRRAVTSANHLDVVRGQRVVGDDRDFVGRRLE
jgi:hypothetical protein